MATLERTRSSHRLVVGIDFGTTYSGVAWAHTSDPNAIHFIDQWPSAGRDTGNNKHKKVRTELAYSKNKNGVETYKWGAQIGLDVQDRLGWFKLLLKDDLHAPQSNIRRIGMGSDAELDSFGRMQAGLEQLQFTINAMPPDKNGQLLATDYLTGLRTHIDATLKNKFPESFLKANPVTYYLTVPAVWTDTAKARTLMAAEAAGLGRREKIQLVQEPEAAATYVFKAFKETEDCLKAGEVYVVADCGGGTVDVISYEVTSLEPLKVRECVMGSGGLCGSTYLDRAFVKLMIERIGERKFRNMSQKAKWTARNHFAEYLKTSYVPPSQPFTPGEDEDEDEDDDEEPEVIYECPVPGVPDDGKVVQKGFLCLTQQDMDGFFDPIFSEITQLVQKQVDGAELRCRNKVTAILLVGGFGSSEYLRRHLAANIWNEDLENIKVLQPPDAEIAIACGAVIYGLTHQHTNNTGVQNIGMVESRVARYSYGTPVRRKFIRGVHPIHKAVHCPITGNLMCSGLISWFVTKGQDIPEAMPYDESYCRNLALSEFEDMLTHRVLIFCSDAEEPPKDAEDESIWELLQLTYTIDLSKEKKNAFNLRRNVLSGEEYYKYDFDILMKRESALFKFWIEKDGVLKGEGKVAYNHAKPQVTGFNW